jgi:hypothetical protein
MASGDLTKAKVQKSDEFYTQLSDIEKEIKNYKKQFKGKVVFCNCDDPYESNFFKYFALNFNFLGLKKLVATCYIGSPIANRQLSLFDYETPENKTTRVPHKIIINEAKDENNDGAFDLQDIVASLTKNKKNTLTRLKGDGDFRSTECIELLKEADIIVTNPPFSMFREYVAQLIEYKKNFIIIGNTNALTYKEIFKLVKDNKIFTGYTNFNVGMYFFVPDNWEKYHKIEDGRKIVRNSNSCWFTNLEVKKHNEELVLYKKYSPSEYPKYDNYDAIEVTTYKDIPMDYSGLMGVPITFLDKYNPEQFEIVGITKKLGFHLRTKVYPNQIQVDANGEKSVVSKLNDGATLKLDKPPKNKTYYLVDGEYFIQVYARILIKRKEK